MPFFLGFIGVVILILFFVVAVVTVFGVGYFFGIKFQDVWDVDLEGDKKDSSSVDTDAR